MYCYEQFLKPYILSVLLGLCVKQLFAGAEIWDIEVKLPFYDGSLVVFLPGYSSYHIHGGQVSRAVYGRNFSLIHLN